MRYDDLIKRILLENSEGISVSDNKIDFYPEFSDDSYKHIKFTTNIPDFSKIHDIKTNEPDAHVTASGVVLLEPDGRIWIRKVANNYGGYVYSFAKGRIEKNFSIQQNALKETFEEMGLLAQISSWLTDIEGDTSITRFYMGKRIGGHPKFIKRQSIQETDFITLTDKSTALNLLNKSRDKKVLGMINT